MSGNTQTHLASIAKPRQPTEIQSVPTVPPEANEVLVKVTAAAINPVDWKMRDDPVLHPYTKDWPTILGTDVAGEIAQLGADVTDFKVGDRVFFQGKVGVRESCALQHYVKMPSNSVGRTPSNISDEEASTISVATMAATVGLYHKTTANINPAPWDVANGGDKTGKGKSIVITGGSSSVGQFAIQLARLSGFERIVTSCSPSNFDLAKSLGATHVLDRHVAQIIDYIEAAGAGQGANPPLPIQTVFDSISDPTSQRLSLEILKQARELNGDVYKSTRLRTINVLPVTPENEQFAKEHNLGEGFILGIGYLDQNLEVSVPVMKALGGEDGWLAKGVFKPNKALVIPGGLNAVEEALEKNKKGSSGQKVVIRPQETSA